MSEQILEIIAEVSKNLSRIDGLSDSEVLAIIVELKNEKSIWDKLASGTRTYLQATLDERTPNYCRGAKPHLKQVLPHRLGFIAQEVEAHHTIGDPTFDNVLKGKVTLDSFTEPQLAQFLRDYVESDDVKKHTHVNLLNNHMRTVTTWSETYDKKHGNNVVDAYAYMRDKKPKIINLFAKSILPNLMGAIARSMK